MQGAIHGSELCQLRLTFMVRSGMCATSSVAFERGPTRRRRRVRPPSWSLRATLAP
jgi:hypothetical protein